MAANGAQYGVSTVHFYWIGAVPAMVFLGLVMMPFYYSSRVRSVPEYLRRRFNRPTHLFNALTFALAAVLTAGVNLYALALVIEALIGWPQWLSIVVSAGLRAGLHHPRRPLGSHLQRGPAVLRDHRRPRAHRGDRAHRARRVERASSRPIIANGRLDEADFSTWAGTQVGSWTNPLGDWIGIVMGLGFVLSFGYWTTNFAEVQRALAAKNLSAAERTPLIGAFPKIFIPFLTIIPGLIAIAVIPSIGQEGEGNATYNDAIPLLMNQFLPNGALGVALAGLLAAFMAGMAANVSSFNTVFTYDIWQTYIKKDRSDHYYLNVGRIVTVAGVLIGIGTAFIAAGYSNIMNYIQALFSYFNAPLFATFIIAMFWKRTTPWAGFWGLVAGTIGAFVFGNFIGPNLAYFHAGQTMDGELNAQMVNFYGAITAFVSDAIVTVIVTLVTTPETGRRATRPGVGCARSQRRRSARGLRPQAGRSRPSCSASPHWASPSSCRSSSRFFRRSS